MKAIRAAAAVLNQTPLDWRGNLAHILGAIQAARDSQASLVCLPELCLTGYGCEDAFDSANTVKRAWSLLLELAPATRGLVACVGLPVLHQNGVFNCSCLLVDGQLAGFVAKRFLAGDGIHYEPRWFKPWPPGVRSQLVVDDQAYPIGDLYFDCGGIRIGFEICEDAWVANRPGAALALKGMDVILNPSASHFAFGKLEIRKRFVLEGSRAFGASYVYANLLGNESGRAIYDGGALIATGGRMAAAGPRFGYRDWYLTTAVVDVEATRYSQARTASFAPRLEPGDPCLVSLPFQWPAAALENAAVEVEPWESSPHLKEEEFSRAEALALFDYLRKSRSHGFVVSLSGGADSSAVCCLILLMAAFSLRSIGPEEFQRKLRHIGGLTVSQTDPQALLRQLLTTVYQATENSSAATRSAARHIADAIGARHLEFEVDPIVRQYTETVSAALGLELNWRQHDVPLQNIQARVRAPGAWLLANLGNSLLLATSNRSEAAVGYATMDGDTCGGLSPLAGIDKAWLRRWLVWLEKSGPEGLFPIPALSVINQQVPTAELRPLAQNQSDEDDLMPYPLLDAIERAAIRDKRSPVDVCQLMQHQFPHFPVRQLGIWVERFFRLWCRNQWKRERYAPSFHLDDENLDPKTWCRWPILSGGFDAELEELCQYLRTAGVGPGP